MSEEGKTESHVCFYLSFPKEAFDFTGEEATLEIIRETAHIKKTSFKICTNRTKILPWISIKVWEAI